MNAIQESLSTDKNDRHQMLQEIKTIAWELVNEMENTWKPTNERKNKDDLAHQLLQVMTKFLCDNHNLKDFENLCTVLRNIIQSKIVIKYERHAYAGASEKIARESWDYMQLFDTLKNLALLELLSQKEGDRTEREPLAMTRDELRSKLHQIVQLRPAPQPIAHGFL